MTGTVLSFSHDSMVLSQTESSALVRLNESIRVQVKRGRRRQTAVGGTLGFLAGGVVGILSLKTETATSPSRGVSLGNAFAYGGLGTVIGAVIGSRFGPTIWEEVPFGRRALLADALAVDGADTGDIVNVGWWTRLESHQVDVAAVLELNAPNLASIEGVWNRLDRDGVVAIVRESRYSGIDYVAYAPSGSVVGALNRGADSASYLIRYPPGTRQFGARLSEGVLTLRSPGDTIRQWLKQAASVDSSFVAFAHGVTLLSPVIVEATRVEQRLSDVGFLSRARALSGTFFTREEIVRLNPRTTAEVLRRVPGFSVSGNGWVSAPRDNLCSGVGY